jgi:hypothetical protein
MILRARMARRTPCAAWALSATVGAARPAPRGAGAGGVAGRLHPARPGFACRGAPPLRTGDGGSPPEHETILSFTRLLAGPWTLADIPPTIDLAPGGGQAIRIRPAP